MTNKQIYLRSNLRTNERSYFGSHLWTNQWSYFQSNIRTNKRTSFRSNLSTNEWSYFGSHLWIFRDEANFKSNLWTNQRSYYQSNLYAVAWNTCRSSGLHRLPLALVGCIPHQHTGSALLFDEDVGRRPDLPVSGDLIWRKISHQRAEGVTTQAGLFAFFRLGGWTLDNKVGRAIGHILDYSLRLAPVELKAVSDRHYTVSDRLRRKELSLPLLYATHWCASSYGRRSLSVKELSSAFDLPLLMQPVEAPGERWLLGGVIERMTPLSLFNAVLDRTLSMIAPILPSPEAGWVSSVVDKVGREIGHILDYSL
jgi:hypothetical protein